MSILSQFLSICLPGIPKEKKHVLAMPKDVKYIRGILHTGAGGRGHNIF